MGYVTGHNMRADDEGGGTAGLGMSPEALFAWIDNYCADNPLDHIMTAARRLVREPEALR